MSLYIHMAFSALPPAGHTYIRILGVAKDKCAFIGRRAHSGRRVYKDDRRRQS